ncbi:MAG: hypothetical protein AB1599_07175 [Planctomycetota bacterium]
MEYLVPVFAYFSPVFFGLIIAFLAASSVFANKNIRGLGKALLYYLTLPLIVLMLIIWLIPSPAPFNIGFVNLLYLTIFLWGWLVMISGVTYLSIRLGANKNVVYIVVALLILLTNSTIFYINPFINAWQDEPVMRQGIIGLAVKINPMLTVASNFFRHDLLRSRETYSLCDIGPYYFYTYADWFITWIVYIIIGAITITLAVIKDRRNTNGTNGANSTNNS